MLLGEKFITIRLSSKKNRCNQGTLIIYALTMIQRKREIMGSD